MLPCGDAEQHHAQAGQDRPSPCVVQVGSVLLAGDAAHRFPPAGAFGMNTGIQVWLPPAEGMLL